MIFVTAFGTTQTGGVGVAVGGKQFSQLYPSLFSDGLQDLLIGLLLLVHKYGFDGLHTLHPIGVGVGVLVGVDVGVFVGVGVRVGVGVAGGL